MIKVTPVMKPVSTECNINCDYCYHKILRILPEKINVMEDKILLNVIKNLSESKQNFFKFIWHGGEPTLAGVDFYERAIKHQKCVLKDRKFYNSIQTNGIAINSEWCDFLKKYDFSAGVSLDGPKKIHDKHRRFLDGKGTFDEVMKSIKLMSEKEINVGIVAVVTKESLGCEEEMLDFFCQNNLFRLNFSPAADFRENGELEDYSINPNQWGRFLFNIFKLWTKRNDPRLKIQLFDSLIQGLIGGESKLCVCRKDCSEFISINHKGEAFFCGRLLDREDFMIGDLNKNPIDYIFRNGGMLNDIQRRIACSDRMCEKCRWLEMCHNGCPVHRLKMGTNSFGHFYFCESMKIILPEIERYLDDYGLIDKERINCYNSE
ncbi:MAG: radical SAM protein [Candidatus Pacebacteria bacterium]|nr:radical SAM protein [Candidatus Paceibacterota bacterium]